MRCSLFIVLVLVALVHATPVIYFSDIDNGQNKNNGDTSKGQTANQHGAFVTIWGANLGSTQGTSKVYINGVEAAYYYQWGNAVFPANLYKSHGMQMIIVQIASTSPVGAGSIYANINGVVTNSIPFTVRNTGNMYYVANTGSDSNAGTYASPFKTMPKAISNKMVAGDTVYVMDGVIQNTLDKYSATLDLYISCTITAPCALVGYPGARVSIGNDNYDRGIHNYAGATYDGYAQYWTISRIMITAGTDIGYALYTGCRGVGNYVNMPMSDGDDGGVLGWGSNMYLYGNELTNMSVKNQATVSKLQHVIYIQSDRIDTAPRLPTEENRTIAYNYLHDNFMNRGINIYSEQAYSGYMKNHYVHDNVVLNQRGPGILLGFYMIGDVVVYNNLIDQAGLGPEPDDGNSGHSCIEMNVGYDSTTPTTVYFYNNIMSRCGFDANSDHGVTGGLQWTPEPGANVTVYFSNNIFYQTNQSPYMATDSVLPASNGNDKNLYYGAGAPPSFDTHAINANPNFIDIANFNFRLQNGSLGLNSGINKYTVVDHDLSGATRPATGNFDMGVYQTTGSPSTSAPTSPTSSPTSVPPTSQPTSAPRPTSAPATAAPSTKPTRSPTNTPTSSPTTAPSTNSPTTVPTSKPTSIPSTTRPITAPPTNKPPTNGPTIKPTSNPTSLPFNSTNSPTKGPNNLTNSDSDLVQSSGAVPLVVGLFAFAVVLL